MSRIAELNVNPQIIWKTLGANQYSERPLIAITIRELLQNSDDAIIASNRNDGKIIFFYEENNNWAKLICRDNGIGMTEDIILDKFLCLGESEKANGSTGGFGIAKAAIIGACDRWSIKTLDNYLDSDMIGKEPIKKVGYSEGTEIILEWDLNSGNKALIPTRSGITRGMEFIKYSNLKSKAEVEFRCFSWDNDELKQWNKYETKQIANEKNFNLTLCKYIDCKSSNGFVLYRLNGLVQFIEDLYGEFNNMFFIADIKTDLIPSDSNYPLSPSRETLKYNLKSSINKFIEPYRINSVSGGRAFKEKINEIKLYPGKRIGEGNNEKEGDYFYSSIPSNFSHERFIENENSPVEYETIIRRVNSNAQINIYADNNQKLLISWARILELGAKSIGITQKESFGIGLILDDNTKAERYQHGRKIYYLVNPKHIPISKPQEAIPKLIFLAAHELAHSRYKNHTEDFTIMHSEIYDKIYEKYTEIKWIRKYMREGV
jgi:hypothetical protein